MDVPARPTELGWDTNFRVPYYWDGYVRWSTGTNFGAHASTSGPVSTIWPKEVELYVSSHNYSHDWSWTYANILFHENIYLGASRAWNFIPAESGHLSSRAYKVDGPAFLYEWEAEKIKDGLGVP